jgi:hypothetical protein
MMPQMRHPWQLSRTQDNGPLIEHYVPVILVPESRYRGVATVRLTGFAAWVLLSLLCLRLFP